MNGPRPRRRAVLKGLAAAGIVVVAPAVGFAGWVWVDSGRSNTGTLAFRNRLRIPPLLDATTDADGRRRFRLELRTGSTEFLPGTRTATWGANGSYLGPTLRARRGDRVAVDVTNRLPETTSIHWHGMHLPARMDGGPHQPIARDATWQPYWTVDQPAATLWYHPHLHQVTAPHVYRGVAGMFLVDDPATDDLPLPKRYGVDDVPLIVQDKKIADDGTLDESKMTFGGLTVTGLLGDKILVNGTYDPRFEVTTELVRLRLLNASNARIYHVGFADDREFALIAMDAGLLGAPERVGRLPLSPGERAEIVVRFAPGDDVVLKSFPPPLRANVAYERLAGGDDEHDLVKFVAVDPLRPSPALPAVLTSTPAPPPTTGEEFRLTMGDFTFNGRTMEMDRLDRVVGAGTVERWDVVNGQSIPHNFHVHGASFHVLDVDGGAPPAHLRGVKDTVYVAPGSTVGLAVSFLPHSDPRSPYMFHCHLLAHEDSGMMGQFVTVSDADRPLVRGDRLPLTHAHGN
ncbi:multicopper oxidase family protein [Micromonospora endolithica]|uniref:multicopper oxidase family protein n=1 Tax=Micromonospora endolithica TaxID=230091 RepID=UPI0011ADD9C0|nr:multicopper oxidase domain-containing protein [Micromonospora endolithica]TWJ21558.1 FtsP/CotA-like multicopper oxidase with cupredoxin domain [Micromonospora endolithica]